MCFNWLAVNIVHESYAFVIGFPEGGTPGWCGDFANSVLQSSCISPPVGDFFLAKSPVFGKAKHPTVGLENAFQNFILVLWTVSKHWSETTAIISLTKDDLLTFNNDLYKQ